LLLARGIPVSGSDAKEDPVLDELRRLGARVTVGHRVENVSGAGRVVYTAAVKEDNPELQEARRLGLGLITRAAMLGELMDGAAILCWDDPNVRRLVPSLRCRQFRYGLEDGAELCAVDIELETAAPRFTPRWRGGLLGEFELGVPGRHNVLNALAALAVALEVGLPPEA